MPNAADIWGNSNGPHGHTGGPTGDDNLTNVEVRGRCVGWCKCLFRDFIGREVSFGGLDGWNDGQGEHVRYTHAALPGPSRAIVANVPL
jgi:hypothetical protein